MTPDNMTNLFKEAGPLVNAQSVVFDEDDGFWAFDFEDEGPCCFRLGSSPEHILVTTPVAAVPESGRERLYELLLRANLAGEMTFGMRLCLEDTEADLMVTLSYDVPATTLQPDMIVDVVASVRGARDVWKDLIAHLLTADGATADGAADEQWSGPFLKA